MTKFEKSIKIGSDQQQGATSRIVKMVDSLERGSIRTRSGLEMELIVVIDGGRQECPTAARFVFTTVRNDTAQNIIEVLNRAARAVQEEFYLGIPITIAAVYKDILYVLQVGERTRTFLVRAGKVKLVGALKRDLTPSALSSNTPMPVDQLKLTRGDQIVVCSDGLFSNISDGEIALIGRYDDPHFAARHLSALAMGKNADDNVTVAVLQYGYRRQVPRYVLFVGIFVAAIIGAVIIYSQLPSKQPTRSQDLGMAFFIEGNLQRIDPTTNAISEVEERSFIEPGETLSTSDNTGANIRLKRRDSVVSTTTVLIPGYIYFAPATELRLVTIDLSGTTPDGEPVDVGYLDLTEISLTRGGVLFVSEGNRKYSILFEDNNESNVRITLLSLMERQYGMGATRRGDIVDVYCLAGSCLLEEEDSSYQINAPGKVQFDLTDLSFEDMQQSTLSSEDWSVWEELCNCEIGP
jgi:hypothetical protein